MRVEVNSARLFFDVEGAKFVPDQTHGYIAQAGSVAPWA